MKIVLDMMGSDHGSQATKEGARLFHKRHPEIDLVLVGKKDELSDMEKAAAHGTIAYIEDLKRQGVIHHIGLSSHTPKVAEKVLDMLEVSCLLLLMELKQVYLF